MRIHTNTLTLMDLQRALVETIPGAWLESVSSHASRSHSRAYEVRLAAPAGRDRWGKMRRPSNLGLKAPTYDEYGVWIERLFELEVGAFVGSYKGLYKGSRPSASNWTYHKGFLPDHSFRHFHGMKYATLLRLMRAS